MCSLTSDSLMCKYFFLFPLALGIISNAFEGLGFENQEVALKAVGGGAVQVAGEVKYWEQKVLPVPSDWSGRVRVSSEGSKSGK